jgi:CubicO group peptidase (beta-lactamase class C family)
LISSSNETGGKEMKQFFRSFLPGLIFLLAAGCAGAATPTSSLPATAGPAFTAAPGQPTGTPPAPAEPATPAPTIPAAAEGERAARTWPVPDWPISPPEAQGMDSTALAEAFAAIQEQGTNLHSLLVIRHGTIVAEAYFGSYGPETMHQQFSITKSVVAALTGIALEQGAIQGVDQPIVSFFPGKEFANPDPRKQALTLEQVLTMTTGLDWEESDPSFARLYTSPDWVEYMLSLPMAADPGSQFHYCSGCSHLLVEALETATGTSPLDFAREKLFAPLGIEAYSWDTNPAGEPIGGWGLHLRPRDMARLGYLFLNEGEWNGKQLVPAGWVAAVTRKHTDTDGDWDYGYQTWVDLEHQAYAPLGLGGQTIYVVPAQDLIVITTAELPGHDPVFALIEAHILPAVRSAEPLPADLEGEARLSEAIEAATPY